MTMWKESIKKINWKQGLRHFLEIASDAGDILIHLRDSPRASDYASISLKVANSWLHHSERLKSKPFKGWALVDLWEYKDYLFDIAKRNYEIKVLQEIEDSRSISIDINGINFGWQDFGGGEKIHGPFVRKEVSREEYMEALGKMVWADLGTTACEIGKKKGVIEDDWGGGITVFKVDRQDNVHRSSIADGILERSKKFLDKGYHRSVMLHGTAGTGKSSAMRYVAKEFGKYSLRINVGDLEHLNSEDMILAIELLKPSTLMIDDFDRSMGATKLLTELEEFNENVQLLMVSVNHIESLDDAVIRPGRFDDMVEVETLDDEIVDKLIGPDIPDQARNRLKRLPIAFIVEFHKRRNVLGLEQALEEVVDLEKRIRKLNKIIGNDRLYTVKKKTKKKSKKKVKLIKKTSL